jgi:hypothetical protein
MRLFAQILTGDVKKWFKSLPVASLNDIASFHQPFLNRWEVNKNPLQILSEYESIKRNQGESVQDYCTRFNNIYNEIPTKSCYHFVKYPCYHFVKYPFFYHRVLLPLCKISTTTNSLYKYTISIISSAKETH